MLGKWFLFLQLYFLSDASLVYVNNKIWDPIPIQPIEEETHSEPVLVNGIIYKTFKKYYCRLFNDVENRRTLLHGTKGWTFPQQDVNLTLTYPSAELSNVEAEIIENYVITGYQIILFSDGDQGIAYINSGGILRDHISLSFISKGITTVSYQFWLYGAERRSIPLDEPYDVIC